MPPERGPARRRTAAELLVVERPVTAAHEDVARPRRSRRPRPDRSRRHPQAREPRPGASGVAGQPDRRRPTADEDTNRRAVTRGSGIGHHVPVERLPTGPGPGAAPALDPDAVVGAASEHIEVRADRRRRQTGVDRLPDRPERTPRSPGELAVADGEVGIAHEDRQRAGRLCGGRAGGREDGGAHEWWRWRRAAVRGRVLGGGVVDRERGGARQRRVGVRRRARDHPARDGAGDADLLVALPVPEVVAVDAARAAVAAAAAFGAAGAEAVARGWARSSSACSRCSSGCRCRSWRSRRATNHRRSCRAGTRSGRC